MILNVGGIYRERELFFIDITSISFWNRYFYKLIFNNVLFLTNWKIYFI